MSDRPTTRGHRRASTASRASSSSCRPQRSAHQGSGAVSRACDPLPAWLVGLLVRELGGDGSSGEQPGRGEGDRGVQQQSGQAGGDVAERTQFDRVEGGASDGVVEGDPEGDAEGAGEQAGGQMRDEERGDGLARGRAEGAQDGVVERLPSPGNTARRTRPARGSALVRDGAVRQPPQAPGSALRDARTGAERLTGEGCGRGQVVCVSAPNPSRTAATASR